MRTAPSVRVPLGITKPESLDRRATAVAFLIRRYTDVVTGREFARTLKPRRLS